MSKSVYELYVETLSKIKKATVEIDSCGEHMQEIVNEWKNTINLIEDSFPGIKEAYDRNKKIQDSFTKEQIDFICFQVGEWYLDWKNKIVVTLKDGQHPLGYAKEELKIMICGE